jgi:hypothetical protein
MTPNQSAYLSGKLLYPYLHLDLNKILANELSM